MQVPSWVTLFDTGEKEHLIEVLRDELKAVQAGFIKPSLHITIREMLLPLIHAYLLDFDKPGKPVSESVRLAAELYFLAADVADKIERCRAITYHIDSLTSLWDQFIKHGSAYRIYHDLPNEISAKQVRSKKQSERAKKPRRLLECDDGSVTNTNQIIGKIAISNEHKSKSPKELWLVFFHELDRLGFGPKEPKNSPIRYIYDRNGVSEEYKYSSFQKVVSLYRTGKKLL
ncbi:hypothetical protein [Methylococcus sp. EFPC2]|uniref:hypothetical protein n=1 Tax=Methylococcus sp. EFPC2 TaxID=2812648 RepID=UPI001967F6E5|nr:hypothetical protein [Methylococcus sp. EFPC2]QSA98720.1 hypothetical protein JWZ97_08035 [Methylococcus sp. EFPC2]